MKSANACGIRASCDRSAFRSHACPWSEISLFVTSFAASHASVSPPVAKCVGIFANTCVVSHCMFSEEANALSAFASAFVAALKLSPWSAVQSSSASSASAAFASANSTGSVIFPASFAAFAACPSLSRRCASSLRLRRSQSRRAI